MARRYLFSHDLNQLPIVELRLPDFKSGRIFTENNEEFQWNLFFQNLSQEG